MNYEPDKINGWYMKALLTFTLIFFYALCKGNAIDNLKTDDDVRAFLKEKIIKQGDTDPFINNKPTFNEKLAKLKFLKLDLNSDGLTDLLVNGTDLFAVVDAGNGKFKIFFIDREIYQRHVLVDVDTSGRPKVIVRRIEDEENNKKPQYDTLIARFNGFIELSNLPSEDNIEQIEVEMNGCMGFCPVYDLAIATDGTTVYNAIKYCGRKGKWQCVADKATTDSLFSVANYIHPKALNNEYTSNWQDGQSLKLTITFKDGSSKIIRVHGVNDPFGLERLYLEMDKLRRIQKWERQ